MEFSGFTRGTLYTPVPDPMFGSLLQQIQDLAELKVTLRGIWLLHRKRGSLRIVSLDEFINDRVLLRSFEVHGAEPGEEIRRGLGLAVARQTFLLRQPNPNVPENRFYLLNTEHDRRASNREFDYSELSDDIHQMDPNGNTSAPAEHRPNIFSLYEDNVGMLSPILADDLKDAEERYPWPWILEAFKIAIYQNKRNWHYIAGILRRWAAEGRNHGKPGRHSPKDDRQKYLEDYKRRWGRSSSNRTPS
jgi:DNA replication protein